MIRPIAFLLTIILIAFPLSLADAYYDDDIPVEEHVLSILKRINDENAYQCSLMVDIKYLELEAIPILIDYLTDKDPGFRSAAAYTFGRIVYISPDALHPLVKASSDEDSKVRANAIDALARYGPIPEVLQVLAEGITDDASDARSSVVRAYALLAEDDEGYIAKIIDAINDESPDVRKAVAYNLSGFPTIEGVMDALIGLLGDEDESVIHYAALILGQIGPDAAKTTTVLAELINDENEEIRLQAIDTLGKIGPGATAALDTLEKALKDEDKKVRYNAAFAIVKIGVTNDELYSIILKATKEQDITFRVTAVELLGEFDPVEYSVIPNLISALGDEEYRIPNMAINGLKHIGPAAVPSIVEAIDSEDERVRRNAIGTLRKMGPDAKDAAPALLKAMNHENENTRQAAARALGMIGPEPGVIPTLVEALKSGDQKLNQNVTESLSQLGPGSVPLLIELLRYEKPEARRRAASTLGRIGVEAKNAVPHLVAACDDKVADVRSSAVSALGSIGVSETGVVPAIAKLLSDRESIVRIQAAYACWRLGPNAAEAVPDLIISLSDRRAEHVRRASALALGTIGPGAAEAIPALIAALEDEDEDVRWQVVESLPAISNSPETIEALTKIASDPEDRQCWKAIRSLGWMGQAGVPALPLLMDYIKNEESGHCITAAKALGNIGPDAVEAVPILLRWLDDICGMKRLTAAQALYHIGEHKDKAVSVLLETLKSPSDGVRMESAWAFCWIDPEPRIIYALIEALDDPDGFVRDGAASALGSMGEAAADAVPRLIEALEAPYADAPHHEIEALGMIGPPAAAALPKLREIARYNLSPWVRKEAKIAIAKIEGTGEEDE